MRYTEKDAGKVVDFWLRAARKRRMDLVPELYHSAVYDIIDRDEDWMMLLVNLKQVVYNQYRNGLDNFLEVGYQFMIKNKDL